MVDGEMQADTAVIPERIQEIFPFSSLRGGANVLIFPDLNAANIAYKLLDELGNADCIGPILTGLPKPIQVLNHGCDVDDIVNITAIASVEAQEPR
jgi:malate dehydrogenase (oxaloacetate-decarboxylating)(NADP+)